MKQNQIKALRGMHDIYADSCTIWQSVESVLIKIAEQYGCHEIRTPILESTRLFKRSVGTETDVVGKEMYSFTDRNNDSISLRPESTACCVRACIERQLLYGQTQRLWNLGPMFRYERPQKGRERQFHQFSVELLGFPEGYIDAELICLSNRIWQTLGIANSIKLQINYLGNTESRIKFRNTFVDYMQNYKSQLDEDSIKRLEKNPLRIFDSKNIQTQNILKQAPTQIEYLSSQEKENFLEIQSQLKSLNIEFEINPKLVRGLDYYTGFVFEWCTDLLGAQATACAGGRYDTLISTLGGEPTPAIGLSLGIERLILILEQTANKLKTHSKTLIYMIPMNKNELTYMVNLTESLRNTHPQIEFITDYSLFNLKKQFKQAHKLSADWAMIMGENETKTKSILIKDLKGKHKLQQQSCQLDNLDNFFQQTILAE